MHARNSSRSVAGTRNPCSETKTSSGTGAVDGVGGADPSSGVSHPASPAAAVVSRINRFLIVDLHSPFPGGGIRSPSWEPAFPGSVTGPAAFRQPPHHTPGHGATTRHPPTSQNSGKTRETVANARDRVRFRANGSGVAQSVANRGVLPVPSPAPLRRTGGRPPGRSGARTAAESPEGAGSGAGERRKRPRGGPGRLRGGRGMAGGPPAPLRPSGALPVHGARRPPGFAPAPAAAGRPARPTGRAWRPPPPARRVSETGRGP